MKNEPPKKKVKLRCKACGVEKAPSYFKRSWVGKDGEKVTHEYDTCLYCRQSREFRRSAGLEEPFGSFPLAENRYWPVGKDKLLKKMNKRLEKS